ncbi:MAG TPA: hypothetical protein VGH87_18950 [Polyangiaceae bacterium]|jgi:hypothetical protein
MTRRGRILCAAGSFTSAVVIAGGVFLGLPARWAPVDVTAAIMAIACAASGAMMAAGRGPKERVARIVNAIVLVLGLGLVIVLAATAGYLSGIYGPVGKGGAGVLVVVALLAIPYLIALPGAQLLYLGPRKSGAAPPNPE